MTKDQAQEFLAESEYWARPENRPPELCNKKKDEESALVVTTGIDIWELGNILRELTNIGHSLNSAPYSPRLMALQEMLLSPNPRDRPSADYILRYLADKKNSPTKPDSTKQNRVEPPVPVPVPVPIAGTGGTKYTYLCGNSSRGWVEGATLDEDSQPDYAFVAKLLKETWEDPAGKIAKFYESLQERDLLGNVVVALKACTLLQYYFLYGPTEVVRPPGDPERPILILNDMAASWTKACGAHSAADSVTQY